MSDYIPFEIQALIMKSLPVKSLVQFRSVSKQWKSFIDSPKFINSHNAPHPHPQRLLISYLDPEQNKQNYISFLDNNTFPKHNFTLNVPVFVDKRVSPIVIGTSKGLVCLYNYTGKPSIPSTVVLWNPSIGKSIVVYVPNVFYWPYRTVIGFAVCPRTNDPKLVKSTCILDLTNLENFEYVWQVEVFSLSLNVWRTLSNNLPDKSIALIAGQEVIDGVIYWLSLDRVVVDNVRRCNFLIMSFDITSEEFTRIDLPDRLSHDSFDLNISLSISKLRDSLVVIEDNVHDRQNGFDVWKMEDGIPKSFTKLFNINPPYGSIERVFGFLRTGAPIIGLKMISDDFDNATQGDVAAFVYVPYSKHIDSIGIVGNVNLFFVNSYTESLLLLDY